MTDEQLLEMQKGLRDLYSKCDSLSEKITQLHSQMPMSYKDREKIVSTDTLDPMPNTKQNT